jgi:predicted RNA-binding protein YlxR (DUF448 family)
VACGRIAPKAALRRLALDGDSVVLDAAGTRPGRGAYVCGAACARRALTRRSLPRAFRRAVSVDEHLVESMKDG